MEFDKLQEKTDRKPLDQHKCRQIKRIDADRQEQQMADLGRQTSKNPVINTASAEMIVLKTASAERIVLKTANCRKDDAKDSLLQK